jgi:cytochrome c556
MSLPRSWLRRVGPVLLAGLLLVPFAPNSGHSQDRTRPRLEAVAETKLLMEGMAMANFRGLGRILKERAPTAEQWVFARGQALLLAETGNLLMLRPPKTSGQDAWMERAGDLRDTAARLARFAAARDLARSRATLGDVSDACNRCHQTFRIKVTVKPFEDE